MLLLVVSVLLALLSIVNKVLLVQEKKSGWTSGIAIGLISAIYFYVIGLKILAVAELGFFIVMLYGYVLHVSPSKRRMFHINAVMSILSLLLCAFLFAGYMTVVETISSLSFIWGGYALTTVHRSWGWLLFLIAHVATSLASFHQGQTAFATLQIVSGLVCVYGLLFSMRPKARIAH